MSIKFDINRNDDFKSAASLAILAGSILWTILLFVPGYSYDLHMWKNWATFLKDGLTEPGPIVPSITNYPPVIIYWLHLGGLIWYKYGGIVPSIFIVKTFVSALCLLAHLYVIRYAAGETVRIQPSLFPRIAVLLAAVSPAILYNGAVWGQIDSLIFPFILLSVVSFRENKFYKGGIWFAIAFAVKMQAIFFAPVLLGLMLNHWRKLWLPALGFFSASILIWFPWIMAGRFLSGFHNAYSSNLDRFPSASINAANFWWIFGKKNIGIHEPLFESIEGIPFFSMFSLPITVLTIGLALIFIFSSICIWGVKKHPEKTWYFATLIAISTFTFAPSMHERYLIPSLLPALMATIYAPSMIFVFIVATLHSFLNMEMVLRSFTIDLWSICSLVCTTIPIVWILQLSGITAAILKLVLTPARIWKQMAWAIPYVLIILAVFSPFLPFILNMPIRLSELFPVSVTQSWGELKENSSVIDRPIRIAGTRFKHGLGTHADSVIEYSIPQNSKMFCAVAGMQDGVSGKNIVFAVHIGDKELWKSRPLSPGDKGESFCVPVEGQKILKLSVATLGDNTGAHANWAQAEFNQ